MTLAERVQRWYWSARLERVQKLLRRQNAGAIEVSARDARFIENLRPDELIAIREAQAVQRWRKDAIYSLKLEEFRLQELLKPTAAGDSTNEPKFSDQITS